MCKGDKLCEKALYGSKVGKLLTDDAQFMKILEKAGAYGVSIVSRMALQCYLSGMTPENAAIYIASAASAGYSLFLEDIKDIHKGGAN